MGLLEALSPHFPKMAQHCLVGGAHAFYLLPCRHT